MMLMQAGKRGNEIEIEFFLLSNWIINKTHKTPFLRMEMNGVAFGDPENLRKKKNL